MCATSTPSNLDQPILAHRAHESNGFTSRISRGSTNIRVRYGTTCVGSENNEPSFISMNRETFLAKADNKK